MCQIKEQNINTSLLEGHITLRDVAAASYLAKLAARQMDAAILNWEMAVSKGPPLLLQPLLLLQLSAVKKTHRLAIEKEGKGENVRRRPVKRVVRDQTVKSNL